jgi:hypothetical protein
MSMMRAADRNERLGEWTHAFGLALKFTKGNFADRMGSTRSARPPVVTELESVPPATVPDAPVELDAAIVDEDVAAAFRVDRAAVTPATEVSRA